ncbi:unnamed protein product [Sphagnum jensenii]|uniref:Uncharacterized protein n=1 Tax=Sphagnum jensenii TaxID=128206 RepID=A0ABP0VF31_9BRYO
MTEVTQGGNSVRSGFNYTLCEAVRELINATVKELPVTLYVVTSRSTVTRKSPATDSKGFMTRTPTGSDSVACRADSFIVSQRE